jgi:N6-L-threonylcarbamoyladenine synthase
MVIKPIHFFFKNILKNGLAIFIIYKKNTFVIAGGVASNNEIRKKLINLSIQKDFEPVFPPANLCSDNAAMIAWAGIERFKLGLLNKLDFPAKARWPLDEKAPFMKGAGIKL